MRRRDFLALTGGAMVAASPAFAQQQKFKRLGIIFGTTEDDPQSQVRRAAFWQGIGAHGWTEKTLPADYRWGANSADGATAAGKALIALSPDVIIAGSSPSAMVVPGLTKTIPIVFAYASGPAIAAIGIQNYGRPDGNVTGFLNVEDTETKAKTIDLLRELLPGITKVAIVYGPDAVPGGEAAYITAFRSLAAVQKLELVPFPARTEAELVAAIAKAAVEPAAGLAIAGDSFIAVNRLAAIAEVTRRRVVAVWGQQYQTGDGAMIGYGGDPIAAYRGAGDYAGLVLNGTPIASLPIQTTRLGLSLNPQTAKAMGITIPVGIVARADEVIE